MVYLAIWFIGLVLALKAALRRKRLIAVILIVFTSWVGLLFYDFYGRSRFPVWLNH